MMSSMCAYEEGLQEGVSVHAYVCMYDAVRVMHVCADDDAVRCQSTCVCVCVCAVLCVPRSEERLLVLVGCLSTRICRAGGCPWSWLSLPRTLG